VSSFGEPPTYTSEFQQQAEWAKIQAKERHDRAQFAALPGWKKLSPWPQLIILALSMGLTAIAWRGLKKEDWRTGPIANFNIYLAVSLLFFNTTAKGSSGFAYSLDQWLFFHSWLFVGVICAVIAIAAQPFRVGWDFYFVKHPAADIVNSAVDHGTPIHGKSLARALSISVREVFNLRPRWHYEHQTEKARKLTEMLERNTELTRAAIERERAREELQDAKQASAEDMRERVWRGRTFK